MTIVIERDGLAVEEGCTAYCGRYVNTNGMQMAVVAVVNTHGDWADWAVYMGATRDAYYQHETVLWTVRHGAKLSEADAEYYFPDIAKAVHGYLD